MLRPRRSAAVFQRRAQLPGGGGVKMGKGQRRFLFAERLQFIVDIHAVLPR